MKVFKLTNQQGLCLSGLDYGATLTSLTLPIHGCDREVLLGCLPEQYPQQQVWLGAAVGRFANRIAGAYLKRANRKWKLDPNQPPHCLHGGTVGFHRRLWDVVDQQQDRITLSLISVDGDQGFPGTVKAKVTYQLDNHDLLIEFTATTDAATPVSLTSHLYFNLDNQHDVRDHQLTLNSDHFIPTDASGIPLTIQPVASVFDLRKGRRVGDQWLIDPQQKQAKGFDHAFIHSPSASHWFARLASADQRLAMEMYTNQPSVQVYSGNWLANTPNRQGGSYSDYAGICLEAQQIPDSPNRPELGDPWLLPGQIYRHITRYRFIWL